MPRCDFCGSRMVCWRYTAGERDWLACEKCRAVIEADDRQGLLERALLRPLPQTVPERYAARHEQKARELHEQFWETRSGPPQPA